MKKSCLFIFFVLISIMFLAGSFVIAAGEGTAAASIDRNKTVKTENRTDKTDTSSRSNCDLFSSRQLRIKCRLEAKGVDLKALNLTDETCNTVKNQSRCALLYAQVQSCYDRSGTVKDQCFKRIAGFTKNNVREERNSDTLRNYMIFLLYDLQEKAEKAQEAGNITADEAAQLIDQIVIVKQGIMNNQTKNQIKPQMDLLKTLWRKIMQ